MNNYMNQRTLFSKPLLNGGRVFLKWNEATRVYYLGNTASTAVSASSAIDICDLTVREINQVRDRLNTLGFTEHEVRWNTGKDTYDSIKEAGL